MEDDLPKIPRARTEPSAEIRQAASTVWQLYIALTDEGFNEKQALTVIGEILRGGTGDPSV